MEKPKWLFSLFSFGKTSGTFNFNVYQDLRTTNTILMTWEYYLTIIILIIIYGLDFGGPKTRQMVQQYLPKQQFSLQPPFTPSRFQNFDYNFNVNGQLKNLWRVGVFAGLLQMVMIFMSRGFQQECTNLRNHFYLKYGAGPTIQKNILPGADLFMRLSDLFGGVSLI